MGLWFVANLLETLALTPFFWPEGPGHLKQLRFVWQCSEKWPERCGIIVSACRGLMELGGRLIECLPSFFLKCRNSATIPTTTTLICGQSLGDIGLDTFLLAWRAWSFETTQIRLAVQWKMAGKVWNHIYNDQCINSQYIYIYTKPTYIYIYVCMYCTCVGSWFTWWLLLWGFCAALGLSLDAFEYLDSRKLVPYQHRTWNGRRWWAKFFWIAMVTSMWLRRYTNQYECVHLLHEKIYMCIGAKYVLCIDGWMDLWVGNWMIREFDRWTDIYRFWQVEWFIMTEALSYCHKMSHVCALWNTSCALAC